LGQIDPQLAFGEALALPPSSVPIDEEIRLLSEDTVSKDGKKMTVLKHAAIFSK